MIKLRILIYVVEIFMTNSIFHPHAYTPKWKNLLKMKPLLTLIKYNGRYNILFKQKIAYYS